jgi:hypothetical protein
VDSELGTYQVVLADLRRNGRTDIVVQDSAAVSVLLNDGKGRFEDGIWTPVADGARCGVAADYNGDGKPDLAVCTPKGITILLGTGKATSPYVTGATIPVSNEYFSLCSPWT